MTSKEAAATLDSLLKKDEDAASKTALDAAELADNKKNADPKEQTKRDYHTNDMIIQIVAEEGSAELASQAAAANMPAQQVGDGDETVPEDVFSGVRRPGLFSPNGEELALFLDPARESVQTKITKERSREILASVVFNDGDLKFWLDEAKFFSQDVTIKGQAASKMLHVLVFPRSGGNDKLAGYKRYRAGNIKTIKDLEWQYGAAEQIESWSQGALELQGQVYWWGPVGVISSGSSAGEISHVLLRGPMEQKDSDE